MKNDSREGDLFGGSSSGIEHVSKMAETTVLSIRVVGHEDTCGVRLLLAESISDRRKETINVPAPHEAEGHSRRNRLIFPSESTL
jgi:hypothetical protein